MKQLPRDGIRHYQELVRRYSSALDLLSPAGLERLPELTDEALRYAELLGASGPAFWLDVGSGAGLPALPLAIARPNIAFTLVERRRRRAAFLALATAQLGLANTTIVVSDVRSFRSRQRFSVVSAQAVGSLALVYRLTRHLHAATITIIARKGGTWRDEIAELERALSDKVDDSRDLVLARHGRLAAVTVTGGLPCLP